jgi:UDP-glucuronate 4-epimerase
MNQGVLVTGAAGFIASHLVERLLARGERVIGIDNFDPFYARQFKEANLEGARRHPRYTFFEADCADVRALERCLDGCEFDVIVHLAGKAGVRPSLRDPVAYTVANVVGTQAMLELARKRGVQRFVFGSSSSVYGNAPRVPFSEDDPVSQPISPYAATKVCGEILCRTHHLLYGTGIIALRFFTVYGARQRPDLAIRKFATHILHGDRIEVFGDGSSERDYTWIDDIVDGTVAAVEYTARHRVFEVINLGGNRTTSLHRLIELLAAALETQPLIEVYPPQPGDVVRTYADVRKARRVLGYAPAVGIEDGITRFVQWLKATEAKDGHAVAGRQGTAG